MRNCTFQWIATYQASKPSVAIMNSIQWEDIFYTAYAISCLFRVPYTSQINQISRYMLNQHQKFQKYLSCAYNLYCFFLLLPLNSGGKVWEGIWNLTPHNKSRSNRWCQWPKLFRTYITVNFCNWVSVSRNLLVSTWVQELKFSHPVQIFYIISQLFQAWLVHIFIRQRQFHPICGLMP